MSVTLTPASVPVVATTASFETEAGRTYLTLRDHRGNPIAYLPASREDVAVLVADGQRALDVTAPRDDALTDAIAVAWTEANDALDATVHAWLAAHPLDA
jgi:Holliday junction resolvasome RuvABC endonuclease subunit